MDMLDQAGGVRAGEELEAARVDAFLKATVPRLLGGPVIRQFAGGASNLTYLLSYPGRELILRRPPFGDKAKGAHDMLREARIMQALRPVYPYVPTVVATCADPAVMGCDFYVMDRIRGIIPRRDMPAGLELSEADTRKLCLNVIDRLIELHRVDVKAAGLEALGKGDGYVRRQIEGWSERFRRARTADAPDFEEVMAWLAAKMPAHDVATCLIHNDYRFDNVVLAADNPFDVIGVLDWEMATLGDPLMDLGNTLAYWVQADDDSQFKAIRRQPTHLPGMLTRAEIVAYYGEKTGLRVDNFDFYLIYGFFRLAVIVQQIYARFHAGQTRNPELASFIHIVHYLHGRCGTLIAASAL